MEQFDRDDTDMAMQTELQNVSLLSEHPELPAYLIINGGMIDGWDGDEWLPAVSLSAVLDWCEYEACENGPCFRHCTCWDDELFPGLDPARADWKPCIVLEATLSLYQDEIVMATPVDAGSLLGLLKAHPDLPVYLFASDAYRWYRADTLTARLDRRTVWDGMDLFWSYDGAGEPGPEWSPCVVLEMRKETHT